MAGKPDVSEGSNPYTNVSSSNYYHDALKWCKMKNLLQSIPGEYFPKGGNFRDRSCTRAVIVTLLYNHNNSVKVDMEKMVQLAVSKKGHDYADRYNGTNYGEYKFSGNWCAQFVSWCAERVGLVGTSDTAAMTYTGDCGDMLNHFLKKRTAYISNYFFTNKNWNGRMEGYGYSTENAIEMYQSFLPKRGDLVFFTHFEDDAVGFCIHDNTLGNAFAFVEFAFVNWLDVKGAAGADIVVVPCNETMTCVLSMEIYGSIGIVTLSLKVACLDNYLAITYSLHIEEGRCEAKSQVRAACCTTEIEAALVLDDEC